MKYVVTMPSLGAAGTAGTVGDAGLGADAAVGRSAHAMAAQATAARWLAGQAVGARG